MEAQSPAERLAAKLEKQFSVSHQSGSAVMEIAFSWDDPEVARQVLAKWLALYIDERSRAAGPQEPVSVLRRGKRQAGRADRRLQGADRPATAPDRRHQLQERLDSLTDQLNKLEAARSADQAEWMAVQGGIANAQASGGKLPREITRSAS